MAFVDPIHVTNIIVEVAQNVILPRFRTLGRDDIHEKHPGDLVTIADMEAEAQLSKDLAALLPGSVVVGEESVAADPMVLQSLYRDRPVWIIDPIDGTTNFVNGNPRFAVIVALVCDQVTLQGSIHDPVEKTTYFALRGQGSWCGERRLGVAAKPMAGMIGATAWRDRKRLENAGVSVCSLGSAAQEYMALLRGTLDFSCYRRLHPWDHAAGVLLHEEAGGVSGLLDGTAYRPLPQQGTLLMAPDRESWAALAAILSDETH